MEFLGDGCICVGVVVGVVFVLGLMFRGGFDVFVGDNDMLIFLPWCLWVL